MTYLAGGHEMGFCTPSSGNVNESALAGTFDTTTSRCSLAIGGIGDVASHADWAFASTTTTPNCGFMNYGGEPGFGGEYLWLELNSSDGTRQVQVTLQRLDGTGTGQSYIRLYYASGTSYTLVGAPTLTQMKTLQKIDLSANFSASGYLRLYVAKSLLIDSGTIDLSARSAAAKLRIYGAYGTTYPSEMICSTASTVRLRGYSQYAASEGADTGGTGAYTDIDEIVYSDVDGISFASAGLIHTFTPSTSTLGGFAVEAVLVGARAALGTTGPTKLDMAINSASDSTNHFTADIALTAGYTANVGIWATDPGTSATWTNTNASTAKFGVKSIA